MRTNEQFHSQGSLQRYALEKLKPDAVHMKRDGTIVMRDVQFEHPRGPKPGVPKPLITDNGAFGNDNEALMRTVDMLGVDLSGVKARFKAQHDAEAS